MRDVAETIGARVEEIERGRRVPIDVVEELADHGLFRLWLPVELGGTAADLAMTITTIEDVSAIDGSAGWVVMIGMTTGLLAGFLAPETAREVYGDPRTVTGGVVQPAGVARRVEGGFVVTGRWPFASGCEHCAWLVGGCLVEGDGDFLLMLFRADEVQIIDTWEVVGLRGTGSHDIAVADVFVPSERAVSFLAPERFRPEPIYGMPIPTSLGVALAAVPLGIARGAIDDLVALATKKTPAMSTSTLAKRSIVQIDLAEAEVALRAARTCLLDAAAGLWDTASAGDAPSDRQRALARSAAINATTVSASVVDRAYTLAGGTSIRSGSPLQRRLRDVHAATQHAIVSRATLEPIGRILLGLPTDSSLF